MSLLYRKFNGITREWRKHGHDDDLTYLYSYNKDNNDTVLNTIKSVFKTGVRKVIKMTFDDNSTLILTRNHKIANVIGEFIEAGEFKIGDEVLSRTNSMPISLRGKKTRPKRTYVYVVHHPNSYQNKQKGFAYKKIPQHRLVVEAAMNNLDYFKFVFILNFDEQTSKTLSYLSTEDEVHHLDENPMNNQLSNLKVLTKEEHARLHGTKNAKNFNFVFLVRKKVISIEDFGEQDTYDIEMEAPYSNFTANDIVVHNSDNRLAYEIKVSGYRIANPGETIKAWHCHKGAVTGYAQTDKSLKVPEPYVMCIPGTIEEVLGNHKKIQSRPLSFE